jgi:long-chain acyl-CoA synthetase
MISIRKGIITKVSMQPPLKQKIFHFICSMKWSLMQLGLPSSFLDFAFKPIKENTGGRLKMAVSGGAPIARETHQFLSTVLCPIVQGYGMTESCGLISIQQVDQGETGVLGQVGPPGSHIEIKLVDVPDTNYSTKNLPNPQGEIFVRGGSITSGYYKQPKVTAETFSADGWLMTGDIGEWQPDGSLSVIDRRKNLVKLAHGEYIALEYLESVYKTCDSVLNICVYADPEKSYAVAIVVPALPNVEKYLKGKGVVAENVSLEIQDLANYPEAKEYIMHGLLDVAKKTDLKPAEKLGDICLSSIEWTPQNELLVSFFIYL